MYCMRRFKLNIGKTFTITNTPSVPNYLFYFLFTHFLKILKRFLNHLPLFKY